MARPPSRLERLVKLIGEQNLPPKVLQPDPASVRNESNTEANQKETAVDPFTKLQSVDDLIQEQNSDNWWEFTPQIPQPLKQAPGLPPKEATSVSASFSSEMNFELDSRQGEPAPLGISFAPFLAVTKFPYKFVKKQWVQAIASAFFDENKIYNREWNIYYIWSDYAPTARPVTFVPEHQLVALMNEINRTFPDAGVALTDELRESGLILNFDDCPNLRPHWLGRSTSRSQYMTWTDNLTMPKQGQIADDRTLQAFRQEMELATEIAKNKSKAAKAKKQTEHIANRQKIARSLLRVQRYVGLMAKTEDSLLPNIVSMTLSPIDYDKPSPNSFDQDVIFVSVDVEAYERSPRVVTEVGVATLDTRDLKSQAPGKVGDNWQELIRARHFRIAEYKHYVNSEFVQGCPDSFEFGKSEFIGKDSIGKELALCFKPPYSGSSSTDTAEKRNIILVGHDISQDINYLQQIGVNILNSGSLIDKIHTEELFRVQTKDPNPRSLGSILYEFDLMGWHLHNAGNDAVYTMWAMLAICVKAASDRGSGDQRKKHEENFEKRTEAAAEQAKQRVQAEFDGWEMADDDGGVSLAPDEGTENSIPKMKGEGEGTRRLYTIGGAVLDV